MPANEMNLAIRPDVVALPGSEGLSNHAAVQLGVLSPSSAKPFLETITISHTFAWLPTINLSLSPDPMPDWLTFLTITRVPHIPGSPTSPFPFGPLPIPAPAPASVAIPPVSPVPYVFFLAPLSDFLVPGISAAHLAAQGPNGFAHFSSPGTNHTLIIAGQVRPGSSPGVKTYSIKVLGGPTYVGPTTPPAPSTPIGVIKIAAVILQE